MLIKVHCSSFSAVTEPFDQQRLLSSATNNKESETWKATCESAQWKVLSMVHGN